MTDTGLQSALNQLPQDLEQPVTPPAPTVPPIQPPPPTPPAEPPVPPEQPTIQKPPSKLARNVKKNGLKIAGGALMFMLLVGGAWFGVKEVQKRQTAEEQAAAGETQAEMDARKLREQKAKVEERIIRERQTVGPNSGGVKAQLDEEECGAMGGRFQNGKCSSPPEGDGNPPSSPPTTNHHSPSPSPRHSPFPSPSPSPGVSPSPAPSPSPSSSVTCTDLSTSNIQPKIGDLVNFTCEANFSAAAPVAFFRYNVDGGSYTQSLALPLNSSGEAGYNLAIDTTGDWLVQCRVCTDNSATTCTAWGQAQ